jgi:hypothetical protein
VNGGEWWWLVVVNVVVGCFADVLLMLCCCSSVDSLSLIRTILSLPSLSFRATTTNGWNWSAS